MTTCKHACLFTNGLSGTGKGHWPGAAHGAERGRAPAGLDPLFAGETDIDQLGRIIARLGSPDEAAWPAVRGLPDYAKLRFAPAAPAPLAEALPDAPAPALDLLARLLRWNPGLSPALWLFRV